MRCYPAAGQDERATPPTTNPTKEEDTVADVGIVNTFRARVKKHSCAYLNFGIEILRLCFKLNIYLLRDQPIAAVFQLSECRPLPDSKCRVILLLRRRFHIYKEGNSHFDCLHLSWGLCLSSYHLSSAPTAPVFAFCTFCTWCQSWLGQGLFWHIWPICTFRT